MPEPIVAARGIRKAFGAVEVLHSVDLDVLPGEVHVLAGENGAGKSTLIRILSGVHTVFSGELFVEGRPRRFAGPGEAARAGIATIHQELSLVPTMSVADNLFLGREVTGRFGRVDGGTQTSEAARLLAEAHLDCRPDQLAEELPLSSRQMLEIARALARDSRLVIFDEPTSALNEAEAGALFARIDALKRQGRAIIYITHRMDEIYRLADRISVLRDGRLVGTSEPDRLPPAALVSLMVGRDLTATTAPRSRADRETAFAVQDLRVAHATVPSRAVVDGLSFTVGRGEVLGLAGLRGSGASEVLHAVFGALGPRASGTASLLGEPFPMRSPRESIERGVVLLASDRNALGLAPDMSVLHNVSLSSLGRLSSRLGWIRYAAERTAVLATIGGVSLDALSLDAPVRTLSGGNQQKTCLARCLLAEPRLLLLDEPTRGIDVAAKADIYRLVGAWAERGIAVVLITSELDELLWLADRILVMHRGRVVSELGRDGTSKDAILAAAMGHGGSAAFGGAA
ncbi:MAG: sugar ABC transporter ATP-binding protein [Acidobacteriota bacterium]